MDGMFKSKLDEKQKHQVNAANETAQQFNERYANMNTTIAANMQDMQNFVDQKVFSGELEQKAQDEDLDYAHDYILTDIKRDVAVANLQVYENIRKYGKAVPTQKDVTFADKLKNAATTFGQTISNRFVAELKGKRAGYDRALLGVIKEQNPEADETTAMELGRLIKYTDKIHEMADNKAGSLFRKLEAKRLEAIKDKKLQDKSKKDLHGKFTFTYLPFVKQYKKGWFGRYYNLDGKRIKFKDKELKPDEYNKELLEGLMLETDANIITDKKVLKQNRDKKAVILQRITKEMLEYGDKFDPAKMDDKYVAEHIIELQEYYSRLNAFRTLFTENQWFFMGKDSAANGLVSINNAVDPGFVTLVTTHILKMAAPVANFLEAHLRSHCLMPNAKFDKRKNYFRTEERDPKFLTVGEDLDEAELFSQKKTLEEGLTESIDMGERSERLFAFGSPFVVTDTSKMSDEDKADYEKRLKNEVHKRESGVTLQLLKNRVRKIKYEQKRPLTKDVNLTIKKDLDAMKESAAKSMKQYNDAEKNEKEKLPVIPYASMNVAAADELVMMDLKFIQEKIFSPAGSSMYMFYGPEIDILYGKLYSVCRLQAELIARKKAIGNQLKVTTVRNLERGAKDKSVKKSIRQKRQKEIDDIRKANLAVYKFASKNSYAGFLDDYMAEERLKRAEIEYDEISRKTEYTKTQMELCTKALKFFLSDPEKRVSDDKDYDVIRRFLNKENLGYMFDVDKVEGYDSLLDEAIAYTEQDLKMDEKADKLPEGMKKRTRSPRERAARIYQVRRRSRLVNETNESVNKEIGKRRDPKDVFARLMTMKPAELSQFNFKGDIPVATEEQRKIAGENLSLLTYVSMGSGVFSPKFYKNKKEMAVQFRDMIRLGYLPRNASFERFMADIEIKIDLLKKWKPNYDGAINRQANKEYAYLDTDAINDMSSDKLKLLKDNLKIKSKILEAKMNAEYRKPKELEGANKNKIIVYYNDEDQSVAYRKLKRQLAQCKELAAIVQFRIEQVKAMGEFEELTEETYNHSLNKHTLELEIEHAQQEEFSGADETYIMIRRLAQSDKGKQFKKSWNKRMSEKLEKDKTYFDQDKNLEKEMNALVLGLREIPIGPALVDMCERNLTNDKVPNEDEFITLTKYAVAFSDIQSVLQSDPKWGSASHSLKLKAYLGREENKELLSEINSRLKVLAPLYKAVNRYTNSKGFIGAGVFTKGFDIKGTDDLTEQEETQLDGMISQYAMECMDAKSELKKNIAAADEVLTSGYMSKLYKMMYESGEKLSLSKIKDWEKIVKKIEKNGYYSKGQASEEEIRWMKAAAATLLAGWPQSFEDFYAEHAKFTTGKAIEETFKRITKQNKISFVEDTDHAADISAIISKRETAVYQGLSTNRRKMLDDKLKKEGYSPNTFKYLFNVVEVNGVGQPADARAEVLRNENEILASRFINKDYLSKGETDSSYKNCAEKRAWISAVMPLFKNAVDFNITTSMTDPAYIKKNFEYLYDRTREFAALKEIYEHEKDILNDPAAMKDNYMNQATMIKIHNAFGPKTRSVYAMFFEMIQAYAKTYFVDEEGHFDIGLTAEEMFGKGGDDPFNRKSKDKKKAQKGKEDKKAQGPDTAANTEKIANILKERQDQFKRMGNRVRAEIDRSVLAEKVSKADELNQTLNAIKVDITQSVFKMAQHKEFAGKLNDVNLLMQKPELAKLSEERLRFMYMIDETKQKIKEVENDLAIYEREKNEEAIKNSKEMLVFHTQALGTVQVKLAETEQRIQQFEIINQHIYDRYNECHDKDGNLKLFEMEGGVRFELIGRFMDFHSEVFRDVMKTYEEFKKMVKDSKANGGKMFTEAYIVQQFKSDEMVSKLRELKKLDLYLGMLEVDRTHFKDKAAKYDVMAKFAQHTEEMKKKAKNHPEKRDFEKVQKAQLEERANDLAECHKFITGVLKDMDQKKENPVRLLHDYVQLIYLTLKSYGVAPDGEIEEDKIKAMVNGKMSEQETRNAAYEEADKIGDAHIALEHEISKYMGFDKATKKKK